MVVVKEEPTVERVRSGKWCPALQGRMSWGRQGLILSWNLLLKALGGALGRSRSAGLELRPQKVE